MSNVSQTIQRFEPTPMLPGLPRINHVVIHGDIVYLCGITLLQTLPVAALLALAQPGGGAAAALGDVAHQTRRICARIDELLATAGTSKAKLLTAQVWLTDMKHFAATTMHGTNGSIRTTRRCARASCRRSLFSPACWWRSW